MIINVSRFACKVTVILVRF